jgi:cation/acetate symporter
LLALIIPLGLIAFFGKAGAVDAEAGLGLLDLARETGGWLFAGTLAALALMALFSASASLAFCGAAAVAGDLYASVIRNGRISRPRERNAGHLASLGLGALALLLALALQKINLAVGLMLALGIAASSTFPVLAATLFWPGATTRGTIAGGAIGFLSAVGATIASPAIWEGVLGLAHAPFPLASPAILSMPLAFFCIWLVSATDKSPRAKAERAAFAAVKIRMETGLPA